MPALNDIIPYLQDLAVARQPGLAQAADMAVQLFYAVPVRLSASILSLAEARQAVLTTFPEC